MEAAEILTAWEKAAAPALRQAAEALAGLTGLAVALDDAWVEWIPWRHFVEQLTAAYPAPLYLVTTQARGLFDVECWLVFTAPHAQALVQAVTRSPAPEPLDARACSVLAEVGEVVASAFVNVLADRFQAAWKPEPLQVHYVTAGWLEDRAPGPTRVLVTEARMRVTGTPVRASLLILPRDLHAGAP
ncbi:MAG: hypothetical protein K6U14_07655 [Firmicutes bacterium]|nr:hypothetical protein [Alicyclobacillaceae bacterium]MCL6497490.1 hypothetical protein [Bacillota bacterium]